MPGLKDRIRDKRLKNRMISERSINILMDFISNNAINIV
jgi:folate-dependent tRNA-U54 methylase TrmFO/GidA